MADKRFQRHHPPRSPGVTTGRTGGRQGQATMVTPTELAIFGDSAERRSHDRPPRCARRAWCEQKLPNQLCGHSRPCPARWAGAQPRTACRVCAGGQVAGREGPSAARCSRTDPRGACPSDGHRTQPDPEHRAQSEQLQRCRHRTPRPRQRSPRHGLPPRRGARGRRRLSDRSRLPGKPRSGACLTEFRTALSPSPKSWPSPHGLRWRRTHQGRWWRTGRPGSGPRRTPHHVGRPAPVPVDSAAPRSSR